MPSRIYCKNNYIVAEDPTSDADQATTVNFLGREVSVQKGHATAGGILMPTEDRLVTSPSCHEVVVKASAMRGVSPGDRVIIYLGGDDGSASANGISAFVKVDGTERFIVHEAFVWAKVKDGEVLPLRHVALTERDDEAFRRHTLGAASVLFLPDAQVEHGMKATGETNDQVLASVTALYERVLRVGQDVKGLERGETVCFSPSYMATKLRRYVDGKTRWFHLVDAREVYFAVGEG